MPSFDISIKADMTELKNALEQCSKEVKNRFDFKGTSAEISFIDEVIVCIGDSDFQLSQIKEIVYSKFGKRNIDTKLLHLGEISKISGDKVKQNISIMNGIQIDDAKKIVKTTKTSKLKVQSSIQGDVVRVSGSKRDVLQNAISLLKKEFNNLPLKFDNFRD
ncbi:MAG: YajQ family cyclic di-GMP-binding protein [Betaproteobacteria bacterium TMED41]|nr:MAG: YajQ family cyclic di-GMP-binding protein [Betaproteobacteria bacterium TMED41]|tara:strand:- start:2417 stop:2902 length:486 start_codon:yes stop_codon:yes gene_type:complete